MELILKIDDKGRILIPVHIRREIGLKRVVKVRVEGRKLVIEPIEDPIEILTETVLKGSTDIEKEVKDLRSIAEKEALKRVKERWF